MTVEFRLFIPQMRMTFDQLVERARVAEGASFTGIALMDHLAPPMAENQPMFEAMMTSTWIAARTSRLGIGHLVLCEAMRHPAVLAKEAVTLDHASQGRFELGIGWGSVPAELSTFGVGDPSARERVRRLAETLEVLELLWTGEPIDYEGEFHRLTTAQQLPVPTTPIPIVIGGAGPRTLELVARHADWWNLSLNHIERLDELRASTGSARVSVQVMVALVTDEQRRGEVTDLAHRRFGMYGDGLVIGNGAELVDHFAALSSRGVERVYTWFADFAAPSTIEAFGHDVIAHLTPRTAPS